MNENKCFSYNEEFKRCNCLTDMICENGYCNKEKCSFYKPLTVEIKADRDEKMISWLLKNLKICNQEFDEEMILHNSKNFNLEATPKNRNKFYELMARLLGRKEVFKACIDKYILINKPLLSIKVKKEIYIETVYNNIEVLNEVFKARTLEVTSFYKIDNKIRLNRAVKNITDKIINGLEKVSNET